MGSMTTRLEQQYPDVAAWLRRLPVDEQSEVVRRLAHHAARRTDLTVPDEGAELDAWSEALDSRGWTRDPGGDWHQDEGGFARARAASAVRLAADPTTVTSPDESVYETIAALGLDAVREELRLPDRGPGRAAGTPQG